MKGIIFAIIIALGLMLWLQFFIAKQFEGVANDKGYFRKRYFHLCFWLGLVGMLLVIALPDRGKVFASGTQSTAAIRPVANQTAVARSKDDELPDL